MYQTGFSAIKAIHINSSEIKGTGSVVVSVVKFIIASAAINGTGKYSQVADIEEVVRFVSEKSPNVIRSHIEGINQCATMQIFYTVELQ